jgi:hypothetical protein
VPERNPARVVYGVIAIGALLAAESGLHETHADAIASAAVTATLYWLAHSYADLLGRRLANAEPLTAIALGHALVREWAVVRGAAIPLVAMIIAWAAGASPETGVTIGLWSAIGGLFVLEVVAGVRARSTRRELVLETFVGSVMALGIVFLKTLLH